MYEINFINSNVVLKDFNDFQISSSSTYNSINLDYIIPDVPSNVSYDIYVDGIKIDTVVTNSYRISNLKSDKTYDVKVVANCEGYNEKEVIITVLTSSVPSFRLIDCNR
ncbi:hypothetical protein [Vallitalea guaymasensis]|uniref:hypothetical protein n=1 Tax=Vallitalea guaymasensis TaxID=1185412 RepID=UPI000DE4B670|nr:hypothetical protein [Vallitalea guaymasensis]